MIRNFSKWLDVFLEEKGTDLEQSFVVKGPSGDNYMSYGVVVEHMKIAPKSEQERLFEMLVNLDFNNASIEDYLRHLAKAIAK